jgi:hypothetical protein
MALALSKDSGCIVLQFLCGQHESPTDPLRGSQGLLRSLKTQLLYSGHEFRHGFINTRAFSEAIKAHHIEDLCVTFRRLIEQLQLNQKILYIIDNISRFEHAEWYHNLEYVVEMLYRITNDQTFYPSLKVLITGSTARTRTETRFPPSKTLLLAKGSPHGRRPITGRTMMSDMRTQRPSFREAVAMREAEIGSEEDYF